MPVAVQSYTVTIGKVEMRGERGRNRKTVVDRGREREKKRERQLLEMTEGSSYVLS